MNVILNFFIALSRINLNGLLFRDTILQYSLTSQPVLKTCHFKRVTYLDGKWACNIEVKSDNCILVTVPHEKNNTSEFVELVFCRPSRIDLKF